MYTIKKTFDTNLSSPFFFIFLILASWLIIIINLGDDSLWQNEIVSYFRATRPALIDTYTEIANDDSAPLYELVFLRPWLLLGHNAFYQRILSSFFSLLTIAIVYRFTKEQFDRQTAFFATFLYAINPIQLYYAREGRMYALLALMTMAWIYFLFKTIRTNGEDKKALWGYAIFAAASVYTHYYGGITLIASSLFVVGYLTKTGNFELGKKWVIANIGAAVFFLPWVPTFLFQLSNDPISSLTVPSWSKFGKITGQFFTGFYWLPGWVEWGISLSVVGFVCGALLLLLIKPGSRNKFVPTVIHLMVIFFVSITIAMVLSKLITPMFVIRYFNGIVPLLIILVAYGVSNLRVPALVFGLFFAIVAVNLVFTQHVLTTVWRKDYRAVTTQITASAAEDDAVLLFSPGGKFWLDEFEHYYSAPQPVTYLLNKEADADQIEQALTDLDYPAGVWVIQSNQAHLVQKVAPGQFDYEVTVEEEYPATFFLHEQMLSLTYLKRAE